MNDTKSRIVAAAIDLFAENGYNNTPIRSIADAVDIQQAAIYNHFSSKKEILKFILEEYKAYTMSRVTKIEELENLEARLALESMFYTFEKDNMDRMGKILKILLYEQFHERMAGEIVQFDIFRGNFYYIKGVLDRLAELGKIREIDTGMYARLFVGVLIASSIQVMHFLQDEPYYVGWNPGEKTNTVSFLIDQILDGVE